MTFAASRVSPQVPPGKPLMKSRMVGTGVVVVVVDVDVLVDVLLVVGMVVGTGAEVDEDVEEVVLMLVVVDEDVELSSVVLDVEVVGIDVVDVVVGVGSVVVVGHWHATHCSGVQKAPSAEPSHCSPGSITPLPHWNVVEVVLVLVLEVLVVASSEVDVLVVDDVLGAAVELDVVGGATVVVVVVGHWQLTHSSGTQNEPSADPSHCSPGSRNALPQLLPVVDVVDVVVGVVVVEVVVGAPHTWRSRNTRSVFTSRA